MRHQSQGRKNGSSNPVHSSCVPHNGQPEASQPQRPAVVHEAHAERIAVRQHGDGWRKKPRRPLRDGADKRENSPEKRQHANRNRNSLRRRKAYGFGEPQQRHVKQNVVPPFGDVEPWCFSFLNELREPSVINVAGQVTRFNPAVPKARNQHRRAHKKNHPAPALEERQRRVFFVQKARPRLQNILQWSHHTPGACISQCPLAARHSI